MKVRIPLSVAFGILAVSCAKSETSSEVKGRPGFDAPATEGEPTLAKDCRDAFTKDFSVDSQAIILSGDEVEGLYDGEGGLTVVIAKNAVKAAARKLGCDEATLMISPDLDDTGAKVNNCAEIAPGINLSKACYIATDDSGPGYFFVHETLPEGVTVSFSRWD